MKTVQQKGTVQGVRISGSHLIVEGYLYTPREDRDGDKCMIDYVKFPVAQEDAKDYYVGREFVMTVELQ